MVQREQWIAQALQERQPLSDARTGKIMTAKTINAFFPQAWFLNVLIVGL